jgi:hypothetical protein
MRLYDVDLPDGLLEAEESGSLVIFAGAGVSIPAPSNYPNFDKLAEDISGGALLRQEREPVDRYLGRLVKHGVHVHELVRKTLSDPKSMPNPLHTNLLRLFKTPSRIKIVTTNFDLHFTTAAKSVFEDVSQLETHSAPALPLGNSFRSCDREVIQLGDGLSALVGFPQTVGLRLVANHFRKLERAQPK